MVYHCCRGDSPLLLAFSAQWMVRQIPLPGGSPFAVVPALSSSAALVVILALALLLGRCLHRNPAPVYFAIGPCVRQIRASREPARPLWFKRHCLAPFCCGSMCAPPHLSQIYLCAPGRAAPSAGTPRFILWYRVRGSTALARKSRSLLFATAALRHHDSMWISR